MTVRSVVIAAMAAGMAAAGCSKPAHVTPPAASSCPAIPPSSIAAAPVPVEKAAPADPGAAFDGPGAERLAVVVLMVPGGADPSVPRQRHEYKLSLAADADTAAVEVDGEPMGAARVQHLSPSTLSRVATRVPVAPARPAAAAHPRPTPAEPIPARPSRVRMMPTNMQPAAYVPPPNGAPIID